VKIEQLLVTRKFELKQFQPEYFAEYASWFVDPELNRQLGPMDPAWLEVVLSQPESAGVTWAAFRGMELVASEADEQGYVEFRHRA